MAVSDEEVQAQQEKLVKMREQLANAERTRVENERAQHNEILMADLKAEEARLEAQLVEAKAASTKTAVKEGAGTPLQAAREAQAAAREQAKAAEKAAAATNTTSEKGE